MEENLNTNRGFRRIILLVLLLICLISYHDPNAMLWEHTKLVDATVGDLVWPFVLIALGHSLFSDR